MSQFSSVIYQRKNGEWLKMRKQLKHVKIYKDALQEHAFPAQNVQQANQVKVNLRKETSYFVVQYIYNI